MARNASRPGRRAREQLRQHRRRGHAGGVRAAARPPDQPRGLVRPGAVARGRALHFSPGRRRGGEDDMTIEITHIAEAAVLSASALLDARGLSYDEDYTTLYGAAGAIVGLRFANPVAAVLVAARFIERRAT